MVVAANPLAAQAGLDILRQGGSAVDAVIAVQMVLTLVEPQSSGIGGGGFLLYFDGNGQALTAYDGRETAPAAATPDMFLHADGTPMEFDEAVVGGLSVGVPGACGCWSSSIASMGACRGRSCSGRRSSWRTRDFRSRRGFMICLPPTSI